MAAHDITETTCALRLARIRWGPTAFRCGTCGHDRGYHLAPARSRTFQCARCRKQRSVTAGTAMHGSKLPLRVWFARGEWWESGDVPTSSAFAAEHGIASSSAWHLNQRFMGAIERWTPEPLEDGGYLLLHGLKCRRPKPMRRPPTDDPTPIVDKAEDFLGQRQPLLHDLALGAAGRELALVDGCPTAEVLRRMGHEPLDLRLSIEHRGIERWLWSHLGWRLRTVCVRWITAYVRHLLGVWSRMKFGVVAEVRWEARALAGPPRNLAMLRSAAARVGAHEIPAPAC